MLVYEVDELGDESNYHWHDEDRECTECENCGECQSLNEDGICNDCEDDEIDE